MSRKLTFRPSVTALESRWLPSVGPYPDAGRNALQASYVAEARTKANDVVFLGDSITQNWGTTAKPSVGTSVWSADFAKLGAANFGIGGDTTQDLLARIEGGDLDGKPKVVVLLIGVNDLSQGSSAEQTALGIASVVQAIHSASPSSKILLLGLLPTDVPFLNASIPEVNALISGLGAEPYVTFINPGVQFEQGDGSAQPALLKDVVHPDAAGYQVLANAIDGPLLQLLGQRSTPAPTPDPTTATLATKPEPTAQEPTSPTKLVEDSLNPDSALIPLIETIEMPTEIPVDEAAKSSPPKSFATELIDVSTT